MDRVKVPKERIEQIKEYEMLDYNRELLKLSIYDDNTFLLKENPEILSYISRYVKNKLEDPYYQDEKWINSLYNTITNLNGYEIDTTRDLYTTMIDVILNCVLLPDYTEDGAEFINDLNNIINRSISRFNSKLKEVVNPYYLRMGNPEGIWYEITANEESNNNMINPRVLDLGNGFGRNILYMNSEKKLEAIVNINISEINFNKDFINDLLETLELVEMVYRDDNDLRKKEGFIVKVSHKDGEYLNVHMVYKGIIRKNMVDKNIENIDRLVKFNNHVIKYLVDIFSDAHLFEFKDNHIRILGKAPLNKIDLKSIIGPSAKVNQSRKFSLSSYKLEDKNPVQLSDIGGQPEAVKAAMEIIDSIEKEEMYREVGARLQKGIILEGPTGTGKTLIARAIAHKVDADVYNIKTADIQNSPYINAGASMIKALFDGLRELREQSDRKIIVLFDEMDVLFGKRSNGSIGGKEDNKTVNAFLNNINGIDEIDGIMFIGTTNSPESIDPAVKRRFENEVHVGLPDINGIRDTYKIYIDKLPEKGKELFSGVDLEYIHKESLGFSQSTVETIVNKLLTKKVFEADNIDELKPISRKDIDETIEKIKKSKAESEGSGYSNGRIGFIR